VPGRQCFAGAVAALSDDLARPVRFAHHPIVRLPITSKNLVETAYALGIDVWAIQKDYVDVRLAPGQLAKLRAKLGSDKVPASPQVLVSNVQELIDKETETLRRQRAETPVKGITPNQDYFKAYHNYNETIQFAEALAKAYPKLVKYTPSIGKSGKGVNILQLSITSQKGGANKKRVWLQGQQHAREWISGATMQYLAWAFASRYGTDTRITKLLDQVEFIIVPICNPDGTEYTWSTNRLWRKNLAMVKGKMSGVDLNRNWPDHWNHGGASTDPGSDVYMGPAPASEPEVKALMTAFAATPNVIASVDFHSFSELVLRPYGWTTQNAPDEKTFTELGNEIVAAIQSKKEDKYVNERVVDLYVASGNACDWFYGLGTRAGKQKNYGISIELSPNANHGYDGFILPPERIIPVSESMVAAMLTMTEYSLAHPLGKQA